MQGWIHRIASMAILAVCGFGLSGCDYWPPALQAQIEQLQAEAQNSAAERARILNQLNETTKVRDELQARLDDVTRANRDLMAKVSSLEHTLSAQRDKVAQLAKAAAKQAPKPAKVIAKTPSKKTDKEKKKLAAVKKRVA